MVSTWQVREVMGIAEGSCLAVTRQRMGGRACGAAHLELLRERDELRLHVRLLLGRHRGQRGRRLLQLLLPRTELRE